MLRKLLSSGVASSCRRLRAFSSDAETGKRLERSAVAEQPASEGKSEGSSDSSAEQVPRPPREILTRSRVKAPAAFVAASAPPASPVVASEATFSRIGPPKVFQSRRNAAPPSAAAAALASAAPEAGPAQPEELGPPKSFSSRNRASSAEASKPRVAAADEGLAPVAVRRRSIMNYQVPAVADGAQGERRPKQAGSWLWFPLVLLLSDARTPFM